MPPRPAKGRLSAAAIVFALLVLATLAAFAWAQRVKRDPLVLDHVSFVAVSPGRHHSPSPSGAPAPPAFRPTGTNHGFTPDGDCRNDVMRIRFRMTVSDHATVQVVKPAGRIVDTLARDRFLKRYHFFTFYWNGRDREGGTAAPGRYKLRVKLLGEGRTLVTPGAIKLHHPSPTPGHTRPRVEVCTVSVPGNQTGRPAP